MILPYAALSYGREHIHIDPAVGKASWERENRCRIFWKRILGIYFLIYFIMILTVFVIFEFIFEPGSYYVSNGLYELQMLPNKCQMQLEVTRDQ